MKLKPISNLNYVLLITCAPLQTSRIMKENPGDILFFFVLGTFSILGYFSCDSQLGVWTISDFWIFKEYMLEMWLRLSQTKKDLV